MIIAIICIIIIVIVCLFSYLPKKKIKTFQFNSDFSNIDNSENIVFPVLDVIEYNKFKLNTTFQDANLILFSDYSYFDQNIFKIKFNKNIQYYINGLNSVDELASKSNLARYMKKYNDYIPKTFIIENNEEIPIIEQDKIYILKKNIQRQEGMIITKDQNIINSAYLEGYVVCQELLQNPYIISKRKINLRIYMLIVCNNNKINFYIYNNGFMYYTPKFFEKNSLDKDTNITTGYIDRQVYVENPLTIQDLYKYLGTEKSTILKNNLIKTFTCIKNSYSDILIEKNKELPGCKFNLFGVDIAPDENLNTTIMEINKGPDTGAKDPKDRELKLSLMFDCFNIIGLSKKGYPNNFIKI